MFGLSSAQLALLQSQAQEAKAAISIGITSPLRYCTGADAIEIDSNWYTPRSMSFDEIKLDTPNTATCAVVLDDLDGVIRTEWYSERFSAVTVDMYVFIRDSGGTWTEVVDLGWLVTTCMFNKRGQFRINLVGGAGLRPRAGLMTGNRTDFMFAPEPGEAMRFGGSGISFSSGYPNPPPPPAGLQQPFSMGYRMASVSDGEGVRLLNDALYSTTVPFTGKPAPVQAPTGTTQGSQGT